MFLGIYREPEFSPGRHMSNDAKILRLVGQALERSGVAVTLATLEEARAFGKRPIWFFPCARDPRPSRSSRNGKKRGAFILNDPEASPPDVPRQPCAPRSAKRSWISRTANFFRRM